LPRILELLSKYGVRATFFITGFIHRLYPELLPALVERGHEIGIHGMYHERLAGLSLDDQRSCLGEHLAEFRRFYPVVGANFIYRMDANTVSAFVDAGLRYFVVLVHHYYRPFAYRRLSTQPLHMRTVEGSICLVPVPVETYALPWFATRLLIDSALVRSQKDGVQHVSVLMHPFRDGSQRHLPQLEAMLRYLKQTRHLKPITLEEMIPTYVPNQFAAQVFASVERINAGYPEGIPYWWTRSGLYFERIATLYRALTTLQRNPTLTLDPDGMRYSFAVYPEAPDYKARFVHFDPLAGYRAAVAQPAQGHERSDYLCPSQPR
jgi:peptidoglycan/xylan/chitin deacetylase (PgdA/CDA1 family)